jgi:50S ribosomal protein L16 3-hydroxylase
MGPEALLRAWLAPPDARAFLDAHREGRALFRAPDARRLGAFAALRRWDALDILDRRRGDVVAWFEARDGLLMTADVAPEVARKLYQAGMTFYVKGMPEVAPVCEAFARLLRLPAAGVACDVFCNQPGATSRAHFDAANVVTVQIKGRKRWRVAPNQNAPAPNEGWATGDRAMAHELRLYARGPMPERMPAGAEEYLLEPGAMLYVPRGYWHETESGEESISLHVAQATVPWAAALLAALRAKLARDPAFRADASALFDASRHDEAEAALGPLLGALVAHAQCLAPDDLLPAPPPLAAPPEPGERFARRVAAGFLVESGPGEGGTFRVAFAAADPGGAERRTTVEMSEPFLRACRLFTGPSPPELSARDVAARVPGLDLAEALELVALLLDVGFLRPAA